MCHVTGSLVFIGQSGLTQPNPNRHVTGPLVFIGQSGLTQSEFTFGLIAGCPFSPRDFPTFPEQGPGTHDFGKNNV